MRYFLILHFSSIKMTTAKCVRFFRSNATVTISNEFDFNQNTIPAQFCFA